MTMRRIAVFTASRAEYGLLTPLLEELRQSPTVDLRLIVSEPISRRSSASPGS